MRRRAFFPNLDADRELATTGSYQPTRSTLEQIREQLPRLAELARDELLLDRKQPQRFDPLRDEVALCWCPTSHALGQLRAAGWSAPPAPSMDVLRAVNDRRFVLTAFDADPALERAWVGSEDDLSWLDALRASRRVRLKRPFGFAGKGQRSVSSNPSADDRRWIEASRRQGFVRELDCDIVSEWSLHGVVDTRGVLFGVPCRQWCDRFGSVIRHERAPAFERATELYVSAECVAERLCAAGYFGPFGIDAFCYRFDSGQERFNALSDLNARFTLLWSVGMGERRAEAMARVCAT
jgi:hypothetical protein